MKKYIAFVIISVVIYLMRYIMTGEIDIDKIFDQYVAVLAIIILERGFS